ncbi:hypothetical protein QEJ31_05455 [Pigmentibacter sp. JX0631]|uniref:hypothetical protein n=1 Tax=Pigmentibacter sp. JX0631 TaxID=2976982 RepID=UPI0024691C76|nr:hypothetical protein [Pigmentibacter sp. JX0631]WGL61040.1 hypothetical protein QEJ31_05455 [Pigmentibacter sp. JX0631]
MNNIEKYHLGITGTSNSEIKNAYPEKSTELEKPKSSAESNSEFSLWGKPGKDAVYLGMWSFHLSLLVNQDAEENWQHDLLAVAYSGFIAGSFINSFNDRCYVFALHRSIYRTGDKNGFSTDLGYNLGVVKGYDSRLVSIADDLKYLPFFQVTYDISWKMLGLQLSYVGTVLTAGFYIEYEI